MKTSTVHSSGIYFQNHNVKLNLYVRHSARTEGATAGWLYPNIPLPLVVSYSRADHYVKD